MSNDSVLYDDTTTSVSTVWHYATGVFSFLCLLCGSLSNGLVIFYLSGKLNNQLIVHLFKLYRNSNLRRPRNFLLINLAVTDLGLLLSNSTPHVIASFNKQWPFGQRGCNFYAFCGGICALTSIATMAAISLTRLVAVINPFSSLKLTAHFTLKCIVCSWIYGSVWMLGPLFGWNRFVFEGFGTTCTFDYVSKDLWSRLFILILVTGGFLIPLTIIIVSYTFILIKLSKRGRYFASRNGDQSITRLQLKAPSIYYFLSANSFNDELSRSEVTVVSSIDHNQLFRKIHRTEVRATRTALLVCTIFCIAWGPYALMAILSQIGFNHLMNVYTTAMLGLFTKTAACINPLIYALSSSSFRQHIYSHSVHSNHHLSVSSWSLNRRNLVINLNE